MKKIKAVVIDDEIFTRSLIVKLISELNSNFEISGEAANVRAGYNLIKKVNPDVIFLDIRMPDGSGFELLNMFDEINFEVVFISGFDSYALKAFEFNALDYILKPIDPEKFSRNLNKVQTKIQKNDLQSEDLKSIIQSYDLDHLIISKIPVHTGKKVMLLTIEDLIYIKAEAGCTLFSTILNERHISAKQLCDFDFILDNHPSIARVNKSIYININYISSYSKGIVCALTMKDGTEIEISRRKKKEILELLSGKK